MVARSRHGPYLLIAILVAAALVPSAHHLFEGGENCEACGAPGAAPVVLAACDGPCGDPTHHHHPGHHDPATCPACQATFLAAGVDPLDLAVATVQHHVPRADTGTVVASRPGPRRSRAPPPRA